MGQMMGMGASMGMGSMAMGKIGKGVGKMGGDWFCQKCGDHQFAKNMSCRNCGEPRPTDGSENIPPDPETFLSQHRLEDHVLAAFRSLDPDSQTQIICRGSLAGARDPNAVLLARIKEGQMARQSMGMGASMTPTRPLPGQDWYCPNCYDLQFKHNENCRICGISRDKGVTQLTHLDPANFLKGHAIEPHVVQQFNTLPHEVQQQVMSGGSLHGARDPTAVLINRMSKTASQGRDDWFCQACGDHQFAKNAICRNCGQPKPTDGSQFAPPDPMLFLANHPVEDHARVKFLSLDPHSQAAIIIRGSLAGARDPTAVLLARVKELEKDPVGFMNKGRHGPSTLLMSGNMQMAPQGMMGGMMGQGMGGQGQGCGGGANWSEGDMQMQMQQQMQQMMQQMQQQMGDGGMMQQQMGYQM